MPTRRATRDVRPETVYSPASATRDRLDAPRLAGAVVTDSLDRLALLG